MNQPEISSFFDALTNSFSYVVKDPKSSHCAIIDSVLNFDYAAGMVTYENADQIVAFVKQHGLTVDLLIETHVHADHLSAAPYIQSLVGGKIGISKHIVTVQKEFGRLFNEGTEFQRNGSQFDVLFAENQEYQIGSLTGKALHTPGHTPACMTHVINGAAFVGDTLFMPDAGTARADFPGGDAATLYNSIQEILKLPPQTQLYMCHDYQPNGRELKYQTSVAEQLTENIHVKQGIAEAEFVKTREARDRTLGMPRLIFPSLQVNMRAGHFPDPDARGSVFLKVPISGLK